MAASPLALRRPRIGGLTAALGLMLLATPALAGTGDEVLAKMDAAMNRADDQTFTYELVNKQAGKDPKKMKMAVQVKKDLRRTEFLSPPDMKGTKALVRSKTQMYIWLPAYKKVRRVASHMTEGGFLGTTFSNDDISTTQYAPLYDANLDGETAEVWKLTLTPKADSEVGYGKIEVEVLKKEHHPSVLRYFDKDMKHVKTERRTGYACKPSDKGEVCIADQHEMKDVTKDATWTKLVLQDWKLNTGLGDSLFSVRRLKK